MRSARSRSILLVLAVAGCHAPDAPANGTTGDSDAGAMDGPMDGPAMAFREVKDPCISTFELKLSKMERVNVAQIGTGVAFLDADNDDRLDVLLASQATPLRFCKNRGDGTFADATEAAGLGGILEARGFAVADYDNDGDQDVYVVRDGQDLLLRNDGGVFKQVDAGVVESDLGYSAAFCDLDNDGLLDLFVGQYAPPLNLQTSPYSNHLYHNVGGGRFVDVTADAGIGSIGSHVAATFGIVCLDFDGDGRMDLYETNDFGMCYTPNRLWHNDGNLHFTDVAGKLGANDALFGMSAATCDFDNDGDLDLHTANSGRKVLLRHDANGFADVAAEVGAQAAGYPPESDACSKEYTGYGPYGMLCGSGDYEGFAKKFGTPDIRQFIFTSWGTQCFDADLDGWQDLATVNSSIIPNSGLPDGPCQPDTFLHNTGGHFVDESHASGLDVLRGEQFSVAVGDFDGDGDQDMVMNGNSYYARQIGGGRLVRNDSRGNHYLAIRLRGMRSNRDGIGARVELTAGAARMMRLVSGAGGLASASPHEARFGLGAASTADEVTIRWPSGTVDRLRNVPSDQVLRVTEGSSP